VSTGKIAYIATVYSHLATFHIPYIQMLRDLGYEVHAYATPDHCKQDLERQEIVCRDLQMSRNPFSLENLRATRQLFAKLKREKYDMIHVHTPNASVVVRVSARLAGCRNVVYTAHGFHFYQGAPLRNWLLYYPVERLLARWTDVLITINEEDYDRARQFPVRHQVVYLPGVGVDVGQYRSVDAEQVGALRRDLGLDGSKFVALCVAELNRNKNHEQFLHAVRELVRRGVPIVALLAGVGEREAELKQLVRSLKLEEQVIFLGFRRDISVVMQLAHIVVLMSEREGLPKSLLEAMAAGKPLLVTNVRGNRELVTSFENGIKVPYGDVAATAEMLARMYDDPVLRAKMGKNSWEKVQKFELSRIAEQLQGIYAEKIQLPRLPDQVSTS